MENHPVSPSLSADQLCSFYPHTVDGSNLYPRLVLGALWSKQPTQIRWGWLLLRFELPVDFSQITFKRVEVFRFWNSEKMHVSIGTWYTAFWFCMFIGKSQGTHVLNCQIPSCSNVQTIPGWRNPTSSQTHRCNFVLCHCRHGLQRWSVGMVPAAKNDLNMGKKLACDWPWGMYVPNVQSSQPSKESC